jgi:hypothetical protein
MGWNQPLPAGVAVALYNSGRPDLVFTSKLTAILRDARPQILAPHAGLLTAIDEDPQTANGGFDATFAKCRSLLPGARLWAGIGLTGATTFLATGAGTPAQREAQVVGQVKRLADVMAKHGAEAVYWDSEEAGKQYPQAGEDTARIALETMHAYMPALQNLFTSYGVPVRVTVRGTSTGGHAPFRFGPWLNNPLLGANLPQFYAVGGSTFITQSSLAFAIDAGTASHEQLVKLGLMRADLPQDVFLQFHHTPYQALVNLGSSFHLVAAWSGSQLDANGAYAMRVLAELHRLGFAGAPGAVRRAQAALGFRGADLDGKFGPATAKLLGLPPPPAPGT